MERDVVVCLAELVWTSSGAPNRNERHWFYVADSKTGCYSNRKCTTIKELADSLAGHNISYEPHKPAEILFGDGYFGRPAIPSAGYIYRPLSRRQRETLERHLARLQKNIKC